MRTGNSKFFITTTAIAIMLLINGSNMPSLHAAGASYLTDPGLTGNKIWLLTPSLQIQGPVGELGSVGGWHISQWGTPTTLSPATNQQGSASDGLWSVATPGSAYMSVTKNAQGFVLDQNFYTQPKSNACEEFAGETDLLIESNQRLPAAGYPAGYWQDGTIPEAQIETLAQLETLTLDFTDKVNSAAHGALCPSPRNYASTFMAVQLINKSTNPEQHIQYQIFSYDSRGMRFNASWYQPNGPWFGMSDDVGVFGKNLLTAGGVRFLIVLISCHV